MLVYQMSEVTFCLHDCKLTLHQPKSLCTNSCLNGAPLAVVRPESNRSHREWVTQNGDWWNPDARFGKCHWRFGWGQIQVSRPESQIYRSEAGKTPWTNVWAFRLFSGFCRQSCADFLSCKLDRERWNNWYRFLPKEGLEFQRMGEWKFWRFNIESPEGLQKEYLGQLERARLAVYSE